MENTEILNEATDITAAEPISPAEDIAPQDEELPPQVAEPTVNEEIDEAETLRRELSELRAHVEEQRLKEEKTLRELEDFGRLFPDIAFDSIDGAVWEKVRDGLPLSAAYALCEREKEMQKLYADQINLRNTAASAGSAGGSPKFEYFSPDEVKAMSREEVRENYASIRRSMDYWRKAIK